MWSGRGRPRPLCKTVALLVRRGERRLPPRQGFLLRQGFGGTRPRRPLSLFVTERNDSSDRLVYIWCPQRRASIVILLNEANRTMDATCNFDLGFAQERAAKSETPNRLPNQQALQMISTGVSLISLSLGFSIFGILIIVNQHQADLNDLSGNGFLATIGGVGAILVGTAFLVAACLHWRFCLRSNTELTMEVLKPLEGRCLQRPSRHARSQRSFLGRTLGSFPSTGGASQVRYSEGAPLQFGHSLRTAERSNRLAQWL
jgi:hypothetical protein